MLRDSHEKSQKGWRPGFPILDDGKFPAESLMGALFLAMATALGQATTPTGPAVSASGALDSLLGLHLVPGIDFEPKLPRPGSYFYVLFRLLI